MCQLSATFGGDASGLHCGAHNAGARIASSNACLRLGLGLGLASPRAGDDRWELQPTARTMRNRQAAARRSTSALATRGSSLPVVFLAETAARATACRSGDCIGAGRRSQSRDWRRRGLWRGTGLAPLSCPRSVMASTFRSISYVRRRSPISLPGLDDCPPRVLTTICAPLPLGSFRTDRGPRVPPCPGRQARSRRSPRSRRCGRDGSTW